MFSQPDTRNIRRNGQLSSCEPCRKSKLRCDHQKPVCSRCVRRGKQQLCSYHPAPMTGLRQSNSPRPRLHRPTRSVVSGNDVSHSPAANLNIDRGTGVASMANLALLSPFTELGLSAKHTSSDATLSLAGISPPKTLYEPNAKQLAEGVDVLTVLFAAMPQLHPDIDEWQGSIGDASCSGPVLKAAWYAVQNLCQAVNSGTSDDVLHKISTTVFEATSIPFHLPPDLTHSKLIQILSGVRWETVGICCALVGMVLSAAQDKPMLETAKSDSNLASNARQLLSASIECRRFCESMCQVNDLTIWLLLNSTYLATWSRGDDSYLVWQLMGDLSSTIFALGILTSSGDDEISYLLEMRRRAVAASFELDKSISTFVSRPPRINRRYCALVLPLDLPDKILTEHTEKLNQSMLAVDEQGWNTDGVILSASRLRAATIISRLRDSVLELSLENTPHDLEIRAKELLRESSKIQDQLPPTLKYRDTALDELLPETVILPLNIQLEHLYTDFLLYKMLVQHTNTHHSAFLQTSHEIVSIVVSVIKRPKIQSFLLVDLEWMTIFYAMPCAISLILALLGQLQSLQQTLPVNRSTIIRDLTVFISCCDWLSQSERGNSLLCKKAQGVLSRSLDFILEHPIQSTNTRSVPNPTPNQSSNNDPTLTSDGLADWNPSSILEEDAEFQEWVNSFGLLSDPWFNRIDDQNTDI